MTQSVVQSSASKREMYELLYSQVKDCFDGLVDYEFRHATLLLVLLGWVVTAEHAQNTLATHSSVTLGAIIGILVWTLGHALWAVHQYRRSNAAYLSLLELGYMPMNYIKPRVIGKGLVCSFCLVHSFASTVICLIIWSF